MEFVSPQAEQTARLKAETAGLRKKRYRGMIALLLGGAGLAADLAGFPFSITLALWGMGIAVFFILKAV